MRLLLCVFAVFIAAAAYPQTNQLGVFRHAVDIGKPKHAGSSRWDETNQTFVLRGAGYNIWFGRDEFHYAYKKLKGDFILTADFEFMGSGTDRHRKIGWMVRASTEDDAPHVTATVHGDGLTVLQWRPLKGAHMRHPQDQVSAPKKYYQTVRLERNGETFTMYAAHWGEPLQLIGSHAIETIPEEALAGIFICSHNENVVEEAKIWNLRIDQPVSADFDAHKEGFLGSRLEILDVSNGKRKVIHESKGRFEAPNWMPDGKKLLFNQDGALFTIAIQDGTPEKLNTTDNKDTQADGTEYSPDGRYIYYNANLTGTMQIWRMKSDGSDKEQLTFDEYNNWFPHLSPDGKWMVIVSFPSAINPSDHPFYERVMLRLMPVSGGAPKVIAHLYGGQGTINVPSWSPDSKLVAFVSYSDRNP